MPYQQLTKDDRYVITHMHGHGFSNAQIARRLGRHPATIGREIARNLDPGGGYHYLPAQDRAQRRRSTASRRYKLDNPGLEQAVLDGLAQRWSPEQVAGRLRLKHPHRPGRWISHEAIYQWIYRLHTQGHEVYECLRRRRKRRRKRVPGERKRGIPGRVGIEKRPAMADVRGRIGDWESDTMEGQKGTGLLMTHVDRKSRFLIAGKLADKRSATFARATCQQMQCLPARLRRTLTADNGTEFSDFRLIERELGLSVYFANPYSPWERGTNENTNGLLRDYFPKGTDFRQVTDKEVAKAVAMLNNRPRKCLGYRTPREVLNALLGIALRI